MLERLRRIFGDDDDENVFTKFVKHLSGCEDEEGDFGEEPC